MTSRTVAVGKGGLDWLLLAMLGTSAGFQVAMVRAHTLARSLPSFDRH